MKAVAILTSGILLFCISCKKSGSNDIVSTRVKTVTYSYTSNSSSSTITHTIIYDANGQITGSQSNNSPADSTTYEASGSKNLYRIYSSNGLFVLSEAFINQSSLLVDSTYEINTSLKDTTETKFFYNNANQVVSSDAVVHSRFGVDYNIHIDYQYDNNGNLIHELRDHDGSIYTYTYSYDIHVPLLELSPAGYFPSIRKNRPTKIVITGLSADNTVFHEYAFDGRNRLVSDITTSLKNDQVNTATYTYY